MRIITKLSVFLPLFLFISFVQAQEIDDSKSIELYNESYTYNNENVLNDVFSTSELDGYLYQNYVLKDVWLKSGDKQYVQNNSILDQAFKYLTSGEIIRKRSLSLFYAGEVYREKHLYQKSLFYFLESMEYAEQENDLELLGEICLHCGFLYQEQDLLRDAKKMYTRARHYFNRSDQLKKEKYADFLAISCLMESDDDILKKYSELLLYAESNKDETFISDLLENMGSMYINKGKMEVAKGYLLKSIELGTSPIDSARKKIILSEIFRQQQCKDSAQYYLAATENAILHSNNNQLKLKYYLQLAKIEEDQSNIALISDYYKKCCSYYDSILFQLKNNSVLGFEDQFYSRRDRKAYEEVVVAFHYLAVVLIVALPVSLLVMYLFWKKRIRMNERLSDCILKIDVMKEVEFQNEERGYKLKQLYAERFMIFKRIALMISAKEKNDQYTHVRKINQVIYGEDEKAFDWEYFYLLIDEMNDGFLTKIAEKYPSLTKIEIQFCGLLKAQCSPTEIAFIHDIAPASIRMRKTEIRKKIGILNGGDLTTFFDDSLRE